MTQAKQLELLSALATDMLDQLDCACNEDGNPKLCECGGDGTGDDGGCWACQAYTALHGHGTPPKETP